MKESIGSHLPNKITRITAAIAIRKDKTVAKTALLNIFHFAAGVSKVSQVAALRVLRAERTVPYSQ